MGFYDVKHARLCNVFEGEGLTHRGPALHEADFERCAKSLYPLMIAGRDVLWVLGGRTDTKTAKLTRILRESQFLVQVFHLCYNTKQMLQFGHFQRQRGIANSRGHELLYLCYKGRAPKQLANLRKFVDQQGSPVFNEVVRSVPVLPHKSHALATHEIRDTSFSGMVGRCVSEVEAEDPDQQPSVHDEDDEGAATAGADAATAGADAATQQRGMVLQAKKKRKLYKTLTGSEVPWFPHDNDIELLKELCHEAGMPRWVYFGTPAGGAGMHGCIELGCSVLALCFDDHHRTHLAPFLVQRAVEAMLGSKTFVFANECLVARARQLRLTDHNDPKKEEEKKEEKQEEDDQEEKEETKGAETAKVSEKVGKRKKRRKPISPTPETVSESSSEDGSPKKKSRTRRSERVGCNSPCLL